MMKLTSIEVEGWNSHSGHHTRLTRHYTNIEHVVRLYPNKVESYLYKDGMHQPFKPGIHHLTRPL